MRGIHIYILSALICCIAAKRAKSLLSTSMHAYAKPFCPWLNPSRSSHALEHTQAWDIRQPSAPPPTSRIELPRDLRKTLMSRQVHDQCALGTVRFWSL